LLVADLCPYLSYPEPNYIRGIIYDQRYLKSGDSTLSRPQTKSFLHIYESLETRVILHRSRQ
jgi:hypothetical protein